MKKLGLLFTLSLAVIGLSGCMTLSPDPKLHQNLPQNAQPLEQSNVVVSAKMNALIAKQATASGIDDLVRQTLQMALKKSNIFNSDSQNYYKIHAQIVQASQAAWSARRFPGKMEIEYTVTDPNGKVAFTKTVFNEGQSDRYYLLGAKRHMRSRIVTAAGNVNQFVEALNKAFQSKPTKKKK